MQSHILHILNDDDLKEAVALGRERAFEPKKPVRLLSIKERACVANLRAMGKTAGQIADLIEKDGLIEGLKSLSQVLPLSAEFGLQDANREFVRVTLSHATGTGLPPKPHFESGPPRYTGESIFPFQD